MTQEDITQFLAFIEGLDIPGQASAATRMQTLHTMALLRNNEIWAEIATSLRTMLEMAARHE